MVDTNVLTSIAMRDVEVLEQKNKEYGDSWKKRGGIGAFMMLARKWDRLHEQVSKSNFDVLLAAEIDSREEGVLDDIRDLRRYLLLVETEICKDLYEDSGSPTIGYINQG